MKAPPAGRDLGSSVALGERDRPPAAWTRSRSAPATKLLTRSGAEVPAIVGAVRAEAQARARLRAALRAMRAHLEP
jgi:hypothetical protein